MFIILFFLLDAKHAFAGFPIEVPLGIPLSLPHYIAYFFWLAMAVGGVMAVLSLIFSGIKLMFAAGDPTKISDAKSQATSAVLGLILMLSSFVLIATINPNLENLQYKESLKAAAPFFFQCSGEKPAPLQKESLKSADPFFSRCSGEKPAPLQIDNIDEIKKEYGIIEWKSSITDLSGKKILMCDQANPNAVYVIYWFKEYNLKGLYGATRLRCGEYKDFANDLPLAKSYIAKKETHGVYFYDGAGCFPKEGSKNIPSPHTASIPEDVGMGDVVRSIRIVNGPDFKKGPFYGLFYFNSTHYRTGENSYLYQHWAYNPNSNLAEAQALDNYSRCFNVSLPSNGVSYAIYQWVGLKDDGTPNAERAGNGISLYSEVSWGGRFKIGGSQDIEIKTGWIQIALAGTSVKYPPNTTTPKKRRDQCKTFDPFYSCLESFEIKGNYLVLVSDGAGKAQIFPISSRLLEAYKNRPEGFSIERGSPEIASDYIGSKSAATMLIIPLAERLK